MLSPHLADAEQTRARLADRVAGLTADVEVLTGERDTAQAHVVAAAEQARAAATGEQRAETARERAEIARRSAAPVLTMLEFSRVPGS